MNEWHMTDAEQLDEFLRSWDLLLPRSLSSLPGVESATICHTLRKVVCLEQGTQGSS